MNESLVRCIVHVKYVRALQVYSVITSREGSYAFPPTNLKVIDLFQRGIHVSSESALCIHLYFSLHHPSIDVTQSLMPLLKLVFLLNLEFPRSCHQFCKKIKV